MSVVIFLKSLVSGYARRDGTVVKPHSDRRTKRQQAAPSQLPLFDDGKKLPPNRFKGADPVAATPDMFDTVTEPRSELIAEHKHLVNVLNSPSHEDDKVEAKKQAAELAEYEGGVDTTSLTRDEATFGNVKKLIGNSLNVHEWNVEGGGHIKAQVKATTRGGTIRTKYLHATLTHQSGKWEYYREQANGTFKLVSAGARESLAKSILFLKDRP